jgi:ribose transport system substrate-binding protein
MDRRAFLKLGSHAVAGLYVLQEAPTVLADSLSNIDASCFHKWDKTTPNVRYTKKNPPYRIAISNSFIGNDWRTEMIKLARAYANTEDIAKLVKELRVANSGNNVSAQIAELEQLILSGYDAIITDAASPTGLNRVITKAVDAGIPVISFDNIVTADKAIKVNNNQVEMGRRWAHFIAEQTKGSGDILVNRGVAGTFGDSAFWQGGQEIFSQHPKIKTVTVYGKWDQGHSQKVVAEALANGKSFDGVWSEYGDTGVVRAFLQSGAKMPPIAGQAENGFRKLAAKHGFPMYSVGVSPGLVAVSMNVALALLQGKEVPRKIRVPLEPVTTEQLKAGVNYFLNQSDSFVDGFNISQCNIKLKISNILQQKK